MDLQNAKSNDLIFVGTVGDYLGVNMIGGSIKVVKDEFDRANAGENVRNFPKKVH